MTGEPAPGTPEQQIGQRIRRLRLRRAWTQKDLASRMQLAGAPYAKWHQTMIAKIENATRPLRVNELADLAAVLGVTPVELLAGTSTGVDSALEALWERVERLEEVKSHYDAICRIVGRGEVQP